MRMLKPLLATLSTMLLTLPLSAQEQTVSPSISDYNSNHIPSWYIGIHGGVPFGISTFSSFGADKTRAGYAVGVQGGHRFNPVLSLEAQAAWSRVNQSAQSCCAGYWLDADGLRYNAPVAGMSGWNYANLKSSTFVQRYGVQLNVNLLGLFNRTKYSRWTLELSPHISATGTQSDIQAASSGNDVLEGGTRWHFGAGGNLQAGYQVCRHLNIGIYSGITCLTGNPMDGMPEYRHKANYIWESGVRLGFTFGGKSCRQTASSVAPAQPVPSDMRVAMEHTECDEKAEMPVPAPQSRENQVTVQSSPTENVKEAAAEALSFPTIYFPFNGTSITESELPKARRILDLLREHPEARVTVTGWCDTRGSRAVNDRISLRRAEAVKAWLVAQGITGERITAVGKGSDTGAPNAKEARRADTEEQKQE